MSDTEQSAGERTQRPRSNLSGEKVRQLLSVVGSSPTQESAQPEVAEYNWHQPHRFAGIQVKKLEEVAKKIIPVVVKKFGSLCHRDITAKTTSITEHFADEFIDKALSDEQDDYYLAFGAEERGSAGFVWIPLKTAFAWVRQLLGESEPEEDSGRDLSQLEESLLLDMAAIIVEGLCVALRNVKVKPVGPVVRGQLPMELRGTEELCKIALGFDNGQPENPEGQTEASVVILCDELEPVVGTEQSATRFDAEAVARAVLAHLQQTSVCVNGYLGSTTLTFEQIMDLGTGDVMLLNRRIDEPIELVLEGRPILRGRPAKSGGKYAVVITEEPQQDRSHTAAS
jgi:flagellar motor switch protein FliM